MSEIYEKWRELSIDPFTIPFKTIKLKEIISYPPAGNDVVECNCFINNISFNVFIKIERSRMANFMIEAKHLEILYRSGYLANIPEIYEVGKVKDKMYLVLEKMEGERLSNIFNENISFKEKKRYLINYGRMLAKIHKIPCYKFDFAKQRIINDFPKERDYKNIDEFIKPYIIYLKNNKPDMNANIFIHGDFHYANILWKNKEISAILDFEYSGRGFKEQDIAWACALRPTQHFMNDVQDIKCFLRGYLSDGIFDYNNLKWCLINAYCHFYLMNEKNEKYKKNILKLLLAVKQDQLNDF
ncbi:MAG: phosphotransferase family protein [Bacilli bacterium]